jgi:hypothetical protein
LNNKVVSVVFDYEQNNKLKGAEGKDDVKLAVYHLEEKVGNSVTAQEMDVKSVEEIAGELSDEHKALVEETVKQDSIAVIAKEFSVYTLALVNSFQEREGTIVLTLDL